MQRHTRMSTQDVMRSASEGTARSITIFVSGFIIAHILREHSYIRNSITQQLYNPYTITIRDTHRGIY